MPPRAADRVHKWMGRVTPRGATLRSITGRLKLADGGRSRLCSEDLEITRVPSDIFDAVQ